MEVEVPVASSRLRLVGTGATCKVAARRQKLARREQRAVREEVLEGEIFDEPLGIERRAVAPRWAKSALISEPKMNVPPTCA